MLHHYRNWDCNDCGRQIKGPEEGYIEFELDENKAELFEIRIIHRDGFSPVPGKESCKRRYKQNQIFEIKEFLDNTGTQKLITAVFKFKFRRINILSSILNRLYL